MIRANNNFHVNRFTLGLTIWATACQEETYSHQAVIIGWFVEAIQPSTVKRETVCPVSALPTKFVFFPAENESVLFSRRKPQIRISWFEFPVYLGQEWDVI